MCVSISKLENCGIRIILSDVKFGSILCETLNIGIYQESMG